MTTALITHQACLEHVTPEGHPEQVARLVGVLEALAPLDLEREDAPRASVEDLRLVHPQSHIDAITQASPQAGQVQLDEDTWMSPGSLEAALRAAGGVVRAVDMVVEGRVQNAFCALRPPGHHAETAKPMGFCLFGNVAIGARHALERHGLERVAVVDFDVHHGNGTQDLLEGDPRALVVTSQQMPLWPGTGAREEAGRYGTILNLPLPPGSDGAHMRAAYEAEVFGRLESFAPQMLFISAGFDAHAADPLANLEWHEDDFAWLTRALCTRTFASTGGRVVSVLEGGYNVEKLSASAAAHVEALIEVGQPDNRPRVN